MSEIERDPAGLHTRTERLARLCLLMLFVVVLLRTAWLCDDAYITLRTVDNCLDGHGLRWNVAERVQSHTNPLWTLVLLCGSAITGELYFTTIAISIVVSMAAVVLLVRRHCATLTAALFAVASLILSKAFIDYSTSGLENPLGHLLLVLFLARLARGLTDRRAAFEVALLAGLSAVNRLDSILFYVPALLVLAARLRLQSLRPMFLGFLPLLLWELFSIVYYGFPFPNTAYAKIGVDIPQGELLHQGFYYWLNSLQSDPLTVAVIGLGLLSPWLSARREGLTAALGCVLFAVYITKIGGDFMSGRHFTPLFLVSVVLLLRNFAFERNLQSAVAIGSVVLLGVAGKAPPLLTDGDYSEPRTQASVFDSHGITDERAFYYPQTGLLSTARVIDGPDHVWARQGARAREAGKKIDVIGTIGFFGVSAGPSVHVLDLHALSDPLLARIPRLVRSTAVINPGKTWRIGHFERAIPEGYLETLESGTNQIVDPDLKRYYEKLLLITRGPLFSLERWKAIAGMNLGTCDDWMEAYVQRLESAAASSAAKDAAGSDGKPQ